MNAFTRLSASSAMNVVAFSPAVAEAWKERFSPVDPVECPRHEPEVVNAVAAVLDHPANAEAMAGLDDEDREGMVVELADKFERRLEAAPVDLPPATALADRAALTRAFDIVANVVERRNTIPILSNICLAGDGSNLIVTGTDLDIEIAVTVPAAADAHFGVTLPAHTMRDLLKKATASEFVGFVPSEPTHGVKVDFEKVNYRLQDLPVADFPNLNAGTPSHSFTLPGAALVDSLGMVSIAVSTEETRYYLNGVFFHHVEPNGVDRYNGSFGGLRLVATDGHRLCRQQIDAPEGSEGMPSIIIPKKTVALLQKLLKGKACPESVAVELSATKIRFRFDGVTITSKLIDGTFPDYERVVPTGNDKPATFNAADLAEGIRAVSVISSERGRAVKMTFDPGKCQLVVNNPDSGSAVADIACSFDGEGMDIGFNAKYVQDFIATADSEEITLLLADAGSPTLVTAKGKEGWLGVLMPMRV